MSSPRPRPRGVSGRPRSGFTLPEVLVVFAVVSLIFAVLYQFFGGVFSTRKQSVVRLTGASLLRQDARLALEKLLDRLEEGIEISGPAPGSQGPILEFRDLLNHRIRLACSGPDLVTQTSVGGAWQTELTGASVTTEDGQVYAPVRPVRIPGVLKVNFRVMSPNFVVIELTLNDGGRAVTIVAPARLRNPGLIEN